MPRPPIKFPEFEKKEVRKKESSDVDCLVLSGLSGKVRKRTDRNVVVKKMKG